MAVCTNHNWVDTQRGCPDCGRPFCDQCLVEFLGQWYCGPCRDRRLYQMQGGPAGGDAPLAGSGVADIGGWLSAGWDIIQADLGTFVLAGLMAALISFGTCFFCLPAMMCGMYMLAFRRMTYGAVEFANLFDGFRRFGWALLTFLVLGALSAIIGWGLLIAAVFVQISFAQTPVVALTLTLGIQAVRWVLTVILLGATFFVVPHVAARNANPGDALAASWEVFRRNPLMFIVTAFVYSVIAVGFGVGFPITFPLITAATAKAYADHFGIQGWDRV